MAKKILVTGANGFVGSHIVDALLRRGDDVRALVRTTSNLQWLQGKPVELAFGEMQNRQSLERALDGVDCVVHNAGIVTADNQYHYYLHNTEATRTLVDAIKAVVPGIDRLVYLSSQAAGGPTESGKLRKEDELALPVTDYGKSKLLAEQMLRKEMDTLPISIVRPPSVYGPRDRAFLPMFQTITRGVMPMIGRQRELSIVHVQDLARLILLLLDKEAAIGEVFHAAPFAPVTQEQLGRTIARVLSVEAKVLAIPDGVAKYGFPAAFPIMKLFKGKGIGFKPDKLPEFLAERWNLSGEKAEELLGFEGKIPLMAGIGQTAEWYRWKKWLSTRRDRMKQKGRADVRLRPINGDPRMYDESCDLCALAFDGDVKTKLHYEDDELIIVDCLICRVPMAVLKEHRPRFTDEEKERIKSLFNELFGEHGHPDFEQRRIPEHAHVHFRNSDHQTPWARRPDDE